MKSDASARRSGPIADRLRVAAFSIPVTITMLMAAVEGLTILQEIASEVRSLPISDFSPVRETVALFSPDPILALRICAWPLEAVLALSIILRWRLSTFLAVQVCVFLIQLTLALRALNILLQATDTLIGLPGS